VKDAFRRARFVVFASRVHFVWAERGVRAQQHRADAFEQYLVISEDLEG
jgi:hypothetical protein